MTIYILPNQVASPGYEYGQEAIMIFGLEFCKQYAKTGQVLVYDSPPQEAQRAREVTK